MDETMPISNTTPGANTLTIDVAGDYLVSFMVLLQSITGDFDSNIGIQVNGAFSEPSLVTSTVLTADFQSITINSIVTLAEGDVLSLAISSAIGGSVLFGPSLNANFSVLRLGQ
jgi:hypothetical protein